MIYAYIFVMAGVTYLIRMLPLTLFQERDQKYFYKIFFILCTLCLSDRYDVSGNFVCDRFSNFSVCGAGSCSDFRPERKKSCNSSVFLLHSCVCYGENFIISVKKT